MCWRQEEYRDKRTKYLSRSESLLFTLYDESVDDDDFALYIDRASTPVHGGGRSSVTEPDTRSAPASRGSSASRPPPPPNDDQVVQRSSSCAVKRPAVGETEGGRLPRPRSAIVTRESAAVDTSTAVPALKQTARDDVAAGSLLAVPSSWYRTELAANVGTTSSRLTANVQLGLPPPAVTTGPATVHAARSLLVRLVHTGCVAECIYIAVRCRAAPYGTAFGVKEPSQRVKGDVFNFYHQLRCGALRCCSVHAVRAARRRALSCVSYKVPRYIRLSYAA